MQEYYLVIVEKKEELKVFECVWMCLEEKLERRERERERESERERERERERNSLENCPKSSFFTK